MTFALVFVLLGSLTVVASAVTIGTYSWFENGTGKTITATFTDLFHISNPISGAPSVEPYALDITSGNIYFVPTGGYSVGIVPAA